ncbi:MAG: DUF721 domain-containing protein [Limisphaerales bacterium]
MWRSKTSKSDPRREILAMWRGVDVTPLEQERARTEKSIKDLMPQIMKDLRLEKRQSESEIVKVWSNLIDPTIAAHARPTGLHNGTLFVSVDSNVWLDEIVRYRRKEILQRLQHSFGRELIKKISFRIG